jgi:hypothetical protein
MRVIAVLLLALAIVGSNAINIHKVKNALRVETEYSSTTVEVTETESQTIASADDTTSSTWIVAESYSWATGSWSDCSVTCGVGSQTRSVYCVNSASVTVADSYCAEITCTYASTESCTGSISDSCPYVDFWAHGLWSDCSVTCGVGVQTREVSCSATLGCVGDQPASEQACFQQVCPCIVYGWKAGTWSDCTNSCGKGEQSRSVLCVDDFGSVADESLCTADKPETTEDCQAFTADNCEPDNYVWHTTSWSSCSVTCGSGIQTRDVYCPAGENECIDEKPDDSTTCDAVEPFCTKYVWRASGYSACSATCGDGKETQSIWCYETIEHVTVDDGYCLEAVGEGPSTSRVCEVYTEDCNVYKQGPWSDCSTTCGEGIKTREIECGLVDGQCTGDSLSIIPCYSSSSECSFDWLVSEWGQCSATCGMGEQTRTYTCITGSGHIVEDSECEENVGTAPPTTQSCDSGVECEDEWALGEWSDCSLTCGLGVQTREVVCLSHSTGEAIDGSNCGPNTPISQKCCLESDCLVWVVSSTWGTCVNGEQARLVTCRSTVDDARYADNACTDEEAGSPPDSTQSCTSSSSTK